MGTKTFFKVEALCQGIIICGTVRRTLESSQCGFKETNRRPQSAWYSKCLPRGCSRQMFARENLSQRLKNLVINVVHQAYFA